jgi:GTP-binding protein
MHELEVGDTICSIEAPRVLPRLTVDAPTMSANFCANDGPFVGNEGRFVTSRKLRERLFREVKSNIALRVEDTGEAGVFEVSGRGELHLTILMETMRREGYEFCVSQPRVITKRAADGTLLEPYEDVVIDLEEAYAGAVIEEMGRRLGQMTELEAVTDSRTRLRYRVPARGLIGYRSQFLTDTRGTGTFYSVFADYAPHAGPLRARQTGVLIALERGTSNAYALFGLQDRGQLFVGTQVEVYGGMIVGESSRGYDIVVNPCRAKKLNNIRTHAHDEKLVLSPPRQFSLEAALEFINADELLEVTPRSIRLRKATLDHGLRKRLEKAG